MTDLPVLVVGAGPIGLATAAHLRERDVDVVVLERGERVGAAVREWGHVRLFSPWSELVDPAAARLLDAAGWDSPDAARFPTGAEWADLYLQPLAAVLADAVRLRHEVTGVTRLDRDVMVDSGRDEAPFVVHARTPQGEHRLRARAVVDASGTWSGTGSLGGDGLPAVGEHEAADRVSYRVPDLTDPATRERYAGRHVVVAGTGASAKTALIGLTRLPGTRVTWLVRRAALGDVFGGGEADQLSERGALGEQARAVVSGSAVTTVTGFRTARVERTGERLTIAATDGRRVEDVDEVVALTGFRPDLSFLGEVRLDLDPRLQAPRRLAPLIDPNVHSCGTVYPHGVRELEQPERGLYPVGMKSYGRAPSFLALTGFEQARSVAAALAGDRAAAERVELVLPETGVCGGAGTFDDAPASGGCCSAPAGPPVVPLGRG